MKADSDTTQHNLMYADADNHEMEQANNYTFIDDRTRKILRAADVRQARLKEIQTLESMKVYDKVPRSDATSGGYKIVKTRWLDVDKGEGGNVSDVRSRCVAKEYNTGNRDDVFAATPALEAVRLLISLTASSRAGHVPKARLMALGVKRAFLYAPVEGTIFIELPEEAVREEDGDVIGRLNTAMYGTRNAPLSWQQHLGEHLRNMGFTSGVANPCVPRHPLRDISLVFHVDDILVSADPEQLTWFQKTFAKTFECTAKVLGPDVEEEMSITFLNRVISWKGDCITYQADPRHVDTILKE